MAILCNRVCASYPVISREVLGTKVWSSSHQVTKAQSNQQRCKQVDVLDYSDLQEQVLYLT